MPARLRRQILRSPEPQILQGFRSQRSLRQLFQPLDRGNPPHLPAHTLRQASEAMAHQPQEDSLHPFNAFLSAFLPTLSPAFLPELFLPLTNGFFQHRSFLQIHYLQVADTWEVPAELGTTPDLEDLPERGIFLWRQQTEEPLDQPR